MTNIKSLVKISEEIIELSFSYQNGRKISAERALDPVFFGYLKGRHHNIRVTRQYLIRRKHWKRPRRIDFRIHGTNPTLIELAVRSPKGGNSLSPKANGDELAKLCRASPQQGKRRILLLIDLYRTPHDEAKLRKAYGEKNGGRGRFKRHSVRVIYVHKSSAYNFLWRP